MADAPSPGGPGRAGAPSGGVAGRPRALRLQAPMPKRILVVEDEPPIADVMARALRAAQYQVVMTDSLAGARARLAAGPPPAAVLVDRFLPDGSGLDFCQEVASTHPELHTLLMTGAPPATTPAAVCAVLEKPFDLRALHAALRGVLTEP
jgi:two-component system OmpR family response regulator